MPHFSQDRSPLKVFTPLGENTLLATRLLGREKLGDGFKFTVSLIAAPATPVDFSRLLGQNASVRVELPGGVVRHFHGEIWEFVQHDSDTAFDHYTMVLRPWLDRLRLIKRSRIFQNLSALDIWKQMLEPLAMPRVFAVHKPLPKRVCCTQFRETDWAFFMRLCSDTGNIHYWKHAENSHTLTITDDTTNHALSLGDIDYNTSVGGTGRATTIHSWCLGQRRAPNSGCLSDTHFELFDRKLESTTAGPATVLSGTVPLTLQGDPGPWEEDEISSAHYFDAVTMSGGQDPEAIPDMHNWQGRKSRIVAYSAASGTVRATAVGNCCQLMPGYSFKLTGHPSQNGAWLVTSVDHDIRVEGEFWSDGGGATLRAEARVECAPLVLPQYHWPLFGRPKVGSMQTAIVIGPPGQEIFTDQFGRVQVRFFWDRADTQSSCWVRVAQVWAGNSWGACFWPRVGHEVVVVFENGDPDRPLIIGSVYNATNMPPYSMPANQYIAGWKSLTQGGDPSVNFHQIIMSDEKGGEVVHIHAETSFIVNQEKQQIAQRPKLDINHQG